MRRKSVELFRELEPPTASLSPRLERVHTLVHTFGAHRPKNRRLRRIAVGRRLWAAASYTGAGERNRTADPFITSEVLYQLSYTSSVESGPQGARSLRDLTATLVRAPDALERRNGATPQNRTGDTVIFSHVLYQLS